LASKQQQLKEAVELNRLRGITAEQMAEINQQFTQFDKNKNQVLDVNEFKACLYSLNEERPKSEVQKIMTEKGDGKGIPFQGFMAFMIELLGDSNTEPEIQSGFKGLAHDGETISEEDLAALLNDDDVGYLKANMAPVDGKYDYSKWTSEVFAR